MSQPPLKSLHPESMLNALKLGVFRKLSSDDLLKSLRPGNPGALKTRPDGTMFDGHHRVRILRERGIDVDLLPREVLSKE